MQSIYHLHRERNREGQKTERDRERRKQKTERKSCKREKALSHHQIELYLKLQAWSENSEGWRAGV